MSCYPAAVWSNKTIDHLFFHCVFLKIERSLCPSAENRALQEGAEPSYAKKRASGPPNALRQRFSADGNMDQTYSEIPWSTELKSPVVLWSLDPECGLVHRSSHRKSWMVPWSTDCYGVE